MNDETKTLTGEIAADAQPPPPSKEARMMINVGERGIELRSLDDLLRFAGMAVASGVAPKGMQAGAAAIAIQAGLERGLGLLGGLQQAVVINGVLSWRGQGAYALIQNSPACKPGTLKAWTEGGGDNMRGVAVAWRTGYAEPSRSEFSVKDAKTAGLWGKDGPWKQYPTRQLKWRALGFLARDIFPDVLGGFPLAEEAADYEVNITPAKSTPIAELPPPAAPDPLVDAIMGKAKPAEAVIEAQAAKPTEIATLADDELEDLPDEAPPFDDHLEADRALADEERKRDEAKQRGLFDGKKDSRLR